MNIPAARDAGILRLSSRYSVAMTAERLKKLLHEHGVLLFAHIDFAADAAQAGLSLHPEQLLIFGNPKAGTPLMQHEPVVGLDLPLKALIWEDTSGAVTLAYNDPRYLALRYGLPAALAESIAGVATLLRRAAED
jgi:uncharacterized protein (DUF302 family)